MVGLSQHSTSFTGSCSPPARKSQKAPIIQFTTLLKQSSNMLVKGLRHFSSPFIKCLCLPVKDLINVSLPLHMMCPSSNVNTFSSLPTTQSLTLTLHPSCLALRCWYKTILAATTLDVELGSMASSSSLTKVLSILVLSRLCWLLNLINSAWMALLRAHHHLLLTMAVVNTLLLC